MFTSQLKEAARPQVPPCKLVVSAFNDSDFFWFTRSLIDCPGVPVGHYAVAASATRSGRGVQAARP